VAAAVAVVAGIAADAIIVKGGASAIDSPRKRTSADAKYGAT
jgi:hypothetical protein